MNKYHPKCYHCKNEEVDSLIQLDKSLAGFHDYGNDWVCLKCRKAFILKPLKDDKKI